VLTGGDVEAGGEEGEEEEEEGNGGDEEKKDPYGDDGTFNKKETPGKVRKLLYTKFTARWARRAQERWL
jgi:hypothetical protein